MPILCTHNLKAGYRHGNKTTAVLSGVNVTLKQGRLTALIGANGTGKSTLLRTLAAVQRPLEGKIEIEGAPAERMSHLEMSRTLAMVFTDRTPAGGLTVGELVALGRQPHTGFLGRLGADDRQAVARAIEAVGIGHKTHCHLSQLSDGERQKAMIARALAQSTPIIALDEPTAFLDAASRMSILLLLAKLARNEGKAILLSTHDVAPTLQLADELWIATPQGRITAGCTEDLVLGGALDGIFATSGARFNALKGDFEVTLPTTMEVALECPKPELRHWTANALRRNGIAVAATATTAITAHSPHDFAIDGQSGIASIAQLCQCLASLQPRTQQ